MFLFFQIKKKKIIIHHLNFPNFKEKMVQGKKHLARDQRDDLESGPTEASMILKDATDPELHLELMNSLQKAKGSGKVIPRQLPEGQARSHSKPREAPVSLTPTFRSRSPTMLRADIRAAGVRGVPPVESSRPGCAKGSTCNTNPQS